MRGLLGTTSDSVGASCGNGTIRISGSNPQSLYSLALSCGLTDMFEPTISTSSITTLTPITTNTTTTDSSIECIPIDDADTTLPSSANPTTNTIKKKATTTTAKSRASNTSIDLTYLSSAHLLAVVCLLSYCSKHRTTSDSSGDGDVEFADHLLKFDAGMIFVYLALCYVLLDSLNSYCIRKNSVPYHNVRIHTM